MAQAHMRQTGTRSGAHKASVATRDDRHLPPVAVAAALALVLLTILVIVGGKRPFAIDEATLTLALSLRTPELTTFMEEASSLITPVALVVAALMLGVTGSGPRPLLASAVGGGVAVGLNYAMKHLVDRPRPPEELRLAVETSSSFPSGHTVTAAAFYGFLIWLVLREQAPGIWRTIQLAAFGLVIVLVGVSRIYLAVHYLSDVVAGLCFSFVWLSVYTRYLAPRLLEGGD